MRWGSSRRDLHEYFRVRLSDFAELEQLSCFGDGGSIDQSQFTALRVSGSLPVTDFADIGNDLVRIYINVEDADGNTHREALATMLPTFPSASIAAGGVTGTVELYSTLYLASCRCTNEPLTIPAGTNAISYASALLVSCGLPVIADASAAALNSDKSYDALTSFLDIVNDLCDFAGFAAADVDGYGSVLLRRYVNPATRSPVAVLKSGDGCVFAPDVAYEFDTFGCPNRYTVVSSDATNDTVLTATAENNDASSKLSYPSRGYWVDGGETVSDIADQDALDALAARRLADASSIVESIEITHVWMPFSIGDVLRVEYPEASSAWQFAAVTRSITLDRGTMCSTRLRRFLNV